MSHDENYEAYCQYMESIARKGGESLMAKRGKEWYSHLGKMSAAKRKAQKAQDEELTKEVHE